MDELTGLGSWQMFCLRLPEHLRSGPVAVAAFDVNHLNVFNGRYHHETGDELLRQIARVLGEQTSECGEAYRLGGDQFALILPKTGLEQGETIAAHVRYRVAEIRVSPRWTSELAEPVSLRSCVVAGRHAPETTSSEGEAERILRAVQDDLHEH